MKIALGQMHIRWEDKAANLARVESWAELLKEKNIDLFVLPEMSLTGFSMHTELTKETDNITVAEAERLARKYQMTVGIGWVKDVGKFCENRYSIVTPEGEILEYTKLHPFSYSGEDRYFQGGTALPVCEYRGYHLGVQICYDLRFPVWLRNNNIRYDLLIIPACWPHSRISVWDILLQARAIENQAYVCGVNRIGHDLTGIYYSGHTTVIDPKGKIILSTPEERETHITTTLSAEKLITFRQKFPVLQDADSFTIHI